ncbi:helix-turn-helix domain-containing protein [Zoogloea sp.]|uniref:helix-turn-helix domain-containing protein n=1 Tax=Zoogloea sp. TaxID=49181 RepID=UPI002630CCEF|nr:helix-turn-helix domain-containing protein [Zoogloea sp.]MDD3352981.1 hypothetical protein [Zoogloea sp.]
MNYAPLLDPDGPASADSSPAEKDTQVTQEMHAAALLLGRYNLRHMVRLYAAFDGDLLLPIVLGQVGLYNMAGLGLDEPAMAVLRITNEEDFTRQLLRPCNAFAISASTGIPRETVRRKVSHLIQHGYIQRDARGGLTITSKAVTLHLHPTHQENLADFVTTGKRVNALLAGRAA